MDQDKIAIIALIFGSLNIMGTLWLAFGRNSAQNVLDDSQAAKNKRDIEVSISAELKELRKENKEIRDILEKAHLMMTLGIEIGEAPIVIAYEWASSKKGQNEVT